MTHHLYSVQEKFIARVKFLIDVNWAFFIQFNDYVRLWHLNSFFDIHLK